MAKQKINRDQITYENSYSYVATDEGTTSTTYAGLATAQTAVINVPLSGRVLVHFNMGIYNAGFTMRVSVALSGANTAAASDNYSIRADSATFVTKSSGSFLLTGLLPGSTTFTAQFKTSGGTARFFERALYVEAK